MKLVVQYAPDQAEKVLSNLDDENLIVDQDTFYHFRDDVFLNGIEDFIKKTAAGKWQETESLDVVEKFNIWYDNQDLIYKYYARFKQCQPAFHLYKNGIYFYKLIGFSNVGNEIQLTKLELEDTVTLLNRSTESVLKKFLRWCSPYYDWTHT